MLISKPKKMGSLTCSARMVRPSKYTQQHADHQYLYYRDSAVTPIPSRSAVPHNPTVTDTPIVELPPTTETNSRSTSLQTPSISDTSALELTTASSRLITTVVVISAELGVVTKQTVYPLFAPAPKTAVLTKADTLADGQPTVWTIITTYSELPKSLFSDVPTTTSNFTVESIPFVGGVAALAIAGLLGYWWRRRRRSISSTANGTIPRGQNEKFEKPELPGSQQSGVGRQGVGGNLIQVELNRQEILGSPILELEVGRPYRNEGAEVHEIGVAERSPWNHPGGALGEP
ncbi:uncharacterized protein PG986_003803 [Apiospora aurea]|uniref:Uncharacterized protein n=1 Tax=Apiospora aurea TaxID=335848 RepID=A0ABR1QSQ1_9PEZI